MDQTALVGPDVSAGRRLVEAMVNDLRIEAAFWWLEDDTWKLLLVTPLVDEQGSRFVYSCVLDFIESSDLPPDLFYTVKVSSPSAGVVTVLDLGGQGKIPKGRFIL